MDFIKVNAQNFLTIAHSGDIFLKDRGLNLISGINDDDTSASSNGSGKSSLVDSIVWSLYGTTARGESGDAVINNKAGKNCAVLVIVEDGSTQYHITRYRKHATGKNSVTVEAHTGTAAPIVLTKGTDKETQLVIDGVLGCTYEVFKSSIYAGQEDMPDIPNMRDKQLKMLIEEAAGVQRLEKAYEVARAKAAFSSRSVETHEVNIERAQAALKNTEIEREGAKLKYAEFETGRLPRIEAGENAAAVAKASALTLVESLKTFDEPAINLKMTALREEIAGSDAARKAAADYRVTHVDAQVKRVTVSEAVSKAKLQEAVTLRSRHGNAKAELDIPCKECGKSHTQDELAQVQAAISGQFTLKADEAKQAAQTFGQAKEVLGALQGEMLALTAKIPDVTSLTSQAASLQTNLNQIAALKNGAREKLTAAQTALAQVAQIREQENPHSSHIAACSFRIAEFSTNITILSAELVQLRKTMDVDAAIAGVYSPSGVRAHILDTVTPFLNDRTAEYLGTLSDGNISATWSTLSRTAKGELREKFVIEVEHALGGKSFGLISGGEKRKVRLSCMLALQDLVASRATKPIRCFFADEVDHALDDPGLERLMTVLEKKARDKGTVIVISHNSLNSYVDQVTTITKSGGVSTVAGALCEAILSK